MAHFPRQEQTLLIMDHGRVPQAQYGHVSDHPVSIDLGQLPPDRPLAGIAMWRMSS
jgi:hypothetical protein